MTEKMFNVQGVLYTRPPLKSSKYKKVNLDKVRIIVSEDICRDVWTVF